MSADSATRQKITAAANKVHRLLRSDPYERLGFVRDGVSVRVMVAESSAPLNQSTASQTLARRRFESERARRPAAVV